MTTTIKHRTETPANGTDDGVAVSAIWIALLVQTNCERSVAAKLKAASFDSYVASQEELRRWSDRLKKVQRIVIPNIVFVRTEPERFKELKSLSFIRGIMRNPGEKNPAIIPDEQMRKLQFMLGQNDSPVYIDNPVKRLNIGAKVRVMRGSFAGLEGYIYRLNEGSLHVGININSLGFAHVNISKSDIEQI